jgi:serine phosphatase RsbU (regulator of sigma subunit)
LEQKARKRERLLITMRSSERFSDILRIAFQYDVDYSFLSRLTPLRKRVLIGAFFVTLFGYAAVLVILIAAKSTLLGSVQPIVRVGITVTVLWALFFGPYFLLILLFLEFTEKKTVQLELKAAHDAQMGLMPSEDPRVKGFEISGACKPADEVGGDYYDFVWLDEKQSKLGIAIADVSGKAMKAAMTAVMTSGMVYNEIERSSSPKSILRNINRPMYLKTDKRVFKAMCFAVLNTKTRELVISNAGQVYPILLRNGNVRLLEVQGERLPLGIKREVRYQEKPFRLKKQDTLVFYTDGITEAKNEKGEMFGEESLCRLLTNLDPATSARTSIERIIAEVQQFAQETPQHDDMTLVVVKVL